MSLEHDGHKVNVAKLKERQRFAFKVRSGKYRRSTRLGDLGCERDVEVSKGVVDADLTCSVKCASAADGCAPRAAFDPAAAASDGDSLLDELEMFSGRY